MTEAKKINDMAREAARQAATEVGNVEAPPGTVFVCAACGKRSNDKYGNKKIDRGWDESCMLNSVLCWSEKGPDGLYMPVPTPTVKCPNCDTNVPAKRDGTPAGHRWGQSWNANFCPGVAGKVQTGLKPSGDPGKVSCQKIRQDPTYEYVCDYQTRTAIGEEFTYIVRHLESGSLWATTVDDERDMDQPSEWYEVEEKETTIKVYPRKDGKRKDGV